MSVPFRWRFVIGRPRRTCRHQQVIRIPHGCWDIFFGDATTVDTEQLVSSAEDGFKLPDFQSHFTNPALGCSKERREAVIAQMQGLRFRHSVLAVFLPILGRAWKLFQGAEWCIASSPISESAIFDPVDA